MKINIGKLLKAIAPVAKVALPAIVVGVATHQGVKAVLRNVAVAEMGR